MKDPIRDRNNTPLTVVAGVVGNLDCSFTPVNLYAPSVKSRVVLACICIGGIVVVVPETVVVGVVDVLVFESEFRSKGTVDTVFLVFVTTAF